MMEILLDLSALFSIIEKRLSKLISDVRDQREARQPPAFDSFPPI